MRARRVFPSTSTLPSRSPRPALLPTAYSPAASNARSVPVTSNELPPQMFRENIGVVVEGTFDSSQTFTAQRLMVKHSNEYRPPTDPAKHDWKNSLEGS